MWQDFFLGFVRIHILHHAGAEGIYGAGIIRELARHGYHLSPGTVYPALHGLEKADYLYREERLVDGRLRKYYFLTPQGMELLAEARTKIRELVREVLDDDQ